MAISLERKITDALPADIDVVPVGLIFDRTKSSPLYYLWFDGQDRMPDQLLRGEDGRFVAFSGVERCISWVRKHHDKYRIEKCAPEPSVVIDAVCAIGDLESQSQVESGDNLVNFLHLLDDFLSSFHDSTYASEASAIMDVAVYFFENKDSLAGYFRKGKTRREFVSLIHDVTNRILLNTCVVA